MLPGGGGGHGCGGLDEGGRHLRREGGSAGCPCIPHQAHAAIDPDVGVPYGGHVEHFQAVVVEPRELALEGPPAVRAANRDGGLGVKYC